MKTKNFPAKVSARRIGALSRLNSKGNGGTERAIIESAILQSRIVDNARDVRTKIYRGPAR